MVDEAAPPEPLLVFALGLLGLTLCLVLAPIAWALGNRYMRICVRQRLEPHGLGRVGRTLGVVGTLLYGSLALAGLVAWLLTYAWTH
ncbi:MAG: hypothetical protein ACI9MC_000707 [Kiritimatiellia bacterium]|jgi:hypothetical protein